MRKLTKEDMPEGYNFAATDEDGIAYAYKDKPIIYDGYWRAKQRNYYLHRIGSGYDASDWQNSLISINSDDKPAGKSLSVIDIPDGFSYAAVDADGNAYAYKSKPETKNDLDLWSKSKNDNVAAAWLGRGYDASDWQNSLIKIDSYEDHAALGVMAHKFQSLHKAPAAEPAAKKDQTNKPSFAEIDPKFLLAMAERMTNNKGKYEPFNWQKPCDANLLLDAAQRHLLALRMPEQEGAEETHLDHAVALALNAMIIHYQLRHNERTP